MLIYYTNTCFIMHLFLCAMCLCVSICRGQDEAEVCELPVLPEGEFLSSKYVRSQVSSFATFLCSMIRDIMLVDCCLLSGGGIRANRDYIDKVVRELRVCALRCSVYV